VGGREPVRLGAGCVEAAELRPGFSLASALMQARTEFCWCDARRAEKAIRCSWACSGSDAGPEGFEFRPPFFPGKERRRLLRALTASG